MNIFVNQSLTKNLFNSFVLLFLFWSSSTSATIIFTQGLDPALTVSNITSDFGRPQQAASLFQPTTTETLGSISWVGFYASNNISATDNFTLRIFENDDSSGENLPSTSSLLLNINVGNEVNRNTDTKFDTLDVHTYSATIPTADQISLTTGTSYWLSIINNIGTGITDSWTWGLFAETTAQKEILRRSDTHSWSEFSSPNHRLQYQLTAVPVPAAVWLFGSALVGLVSFRKKQKA